jgi:hypothetical protein
MGNAREWQVFLAFPDVATATPVAEYLTLHDCPACVFPVPPSFNLTPMAEVRVPAEFMQRAHHIWSRADVLGDLTDGELEYLATGRLAGDRPGSHEHDNAA